MLKVFPDMKNTERLNVVELSPIELVEIGGGQQDGWEGGGSFEWDPNSSFFRNIGRAIGYAAGRLYEDVIIPFYELNSPV